MRALEAVTAVLLCVAAAAVTAVGVFFLVSAAVRAEPQPVYTPKPVPSVFCPSGQHVTGISESGWPDCAPNR